MNPSKLKMYILDKCTFDKTTHRTPYVGEVGVNKKMYIKRSIRLR